MERDAVGVPGMEPEGLIEVNTYLTYNQLIIYTFCLI